MMFEKKPTIGYYCGYVPFEIILAAGLDCTRVTGFPARGSHGDTYLPHNFCSFSRNSLSLAHERELENLDGIILTNADQAMERLYDCLKLQMRDKFVYLLDVPRNRDDSAVNYFRNRLVDLADALGEVFGNNGAKDLHCVMKQVNQQRENLLNYYAHPRGAVAAGKVHHAVRSFARNPADFKPLASPTGKLTRDGVPIVVIGGLLEDEFLLEYLEDRGAVIVHEDLCTGRRFCDLSTDIAMIDPFLALAKGYMLRPPCSRMNDHSQKLDDLRKSCENTQAAGIVYIATQFNVPESYEAVMIRDELCRDADIPFLLVENNSCRSISEVELNRIDAFMEMVA